MRVHALILGVAVCLTTGAVAQSRDETLADIRQEMSVLYVEIQRLKRELSTTGGVQQNTGTGSALQRIDAIEHELQGLTSKTESLEFRINKIVSDGTNRLGDLEFRLCELEPACDIATLGESSTLGGAGQLTNAPVATPAPAPVAPGGAELAVGERADFEAAQSDLEAGNYQVAADKFASFTETYPGGPMTGQAHFLRGEALAKMGQTAPAARAYLESFSGSPDGPRAPEALYKLGVSLSDLGQNQEACVTLGEVGVRFPGAPVAAQANAKRQAIGCS